MIKILLCCAGGFSSSILSHRVATEILESDMQNDYYIDSSPFRLANEKMSEFDIVVCCPHLKFDMERMIRTVNPDKPFYLLTPRMYGLMCFKELSLDVIDALILYNKTKMNPVCFPGEEKTFKITRNVAYRNRKM